jgi:ketosteroid isomerase-like protein
MSRPEYYGNPAALTAERDVVQAVHGAFAAGDVEGAVAHFDADCELHLRPTAEMTGRSEPYRGHEGVREYFADVQRVWDELTLYPDDFRLMPGVVVVLGRVHARRGATTAERSVMWTWRLRDGRVTSVRVADTGELRPAG